MKKIPLKLTAPIDFEFQLTMLQPHPAFNVDPLAGRKYITLEKRFLGHVLARPPKKSYELV